MANREGEVCSNLNNNISGQIVSEPVYGEFNQRLVVRPDKKDFNILIFSKRDQSWNYGDRINFQGQLYAPHDFLTDTGKEFSYKNYLLKDNILCVGRGGSLALLSHQIGWSITKSLLDFKREFLATINHYFPEPEAPLLSGILLGVQSSLPKNITDDYRRAGLTHILVLSGQNISIIASALLIAFSWAGPFISFIIVVVGLCAFTLMAGAGASVVRATVMGLLASVARICGRPYSGGLSLVVAGALMVWANPSLLVFDLGFQLSFLATLGLFYGTPLMNHLFKFLPEALGFREIVSISAGAILFTSPWLIYSFGQFSLFALPANILVVPMVEATMFFGFITVVLGWLSLPPAWIFAFVSHLFLRLNLIITTFFAHLPGSMMIIKNISLTAVIGVYLIIFFLIIYDRKYLVSRTDTVEI